MARLTRSQSQEQTRQRLTEAARDLFRTEGFVATSVDRIAEAAGYSKGAVYSNFGGKEDIFLAALRAEGMQSMAALTQALREAENAAQIIAVLADWANERAGSGNWALTIMEHARLVDGNAASLVEQESILRTQWCELGQCLLPRFPALAARAGGSAELIGALLFELAYAPALSPASNPRPGDLVKLVMEPLLADPGL